MSALRYDTGYWALEKSNRDGYNKSSDILKEIEITIQDDDDQVRPA